MVFGSRDSAKPRIALKIAVAAPQQTFVSSRRASALACAGVAHRSLRQVSLCHFRSQVGSSRAYGSKPASAEQHCEERVAPATTVDATIVNAVLYVLSTGCQWRAIPKDLPPRSTVYDYFDLWDYDGTLLRIHDALYVACREKEGRAASPTAAIIDSQSINGAEKGARRSTLPATTRGRKSEAKSAIFSSIRKVS